MAECVHNMEEDWCADCQAQSAGTGRGVARSSVRRVVPGITANVPDEFNILTEAVAETIFPISTEGRPVYILPSEEQLSAIARETNLEGNALEAITHLVKKSLQLQQLGTNPFDWHHRAANRHSRNPSQTPPALPLLMLFAIAAERMHADSQIAAHNYYSRLHELLGIPENGRGRVESAYRQVASVLWDSLNLWLDAWEGTRGIPTATAVGGHAYVGIPLSQAVMREHDREGVHNFFVLEGLTPGTQLTADEMASSMALYVTDAVASPFSSHLLRLWRESSARDRLIDATCLELETWDGT